MKNNNYSYLLDITAIITTYIVRWQKITQVIVDKDLLENYGIC
jgi:hypothetical protein